jgi:UrcA family protein
MDTKSAFISAGAFVGVALAVCTFATRSAEAKDLRFTVAYQVSTQAFDLNKPSGARVSYFRLKHAADVVRTRMRVDLAPPLNTKTCYEQALGQTNSVGQSAPAHAALHGESYAAGNRGPRDRRAGAIGVA